MSLRRRAVFGIVLVSALLMSGLLVFDRLVISGQFDEVEDREARRDVRRAANSIDIVAQSLGVLLGDWAIWDDTYNFMETRDPAYIESNLVEDIETALDIDAFVFVNADRTPILARTRNLDGQEAPIPELEQGGAGLTTILAHVANNGQALGIVTMDGPTPMLIAALPIVRSDMSGTPRGTLIMGRWLDDAFASTLTETLGTPVRFYEPPRDIAIDDDGRSTAIARREGDTVLGWVVVADLDGIPAIGIETSQVRDIGVLRDQTFLLATGAVGATTIALMAVILAVVHRGLLRPTLRLRHELAGIEWGTAGARLTAEGNDEIAEIAKDVNEMLDRLQASSVEQARLTRVASEQEEVARTALLEMSEGFLAFDQEGRCRLCNPAAARMLRMAPKDTWGKHFAELLPSIHGNTGGETLQLAEIGGRTIAVTRDSGAPNARQRAVVVLRDVSDVLDIERLKRDIIQTVSHELRTPLTAIKATVDLFETGDSGALNEVQLRMVGLMSRNTDRLMTIVTDLLAVSSLEGGNVTLIRDPVDLAVMATRVAEDLRPAATAANVTLLVNAPAPAPAWGDEQRLRHVMENLVQNAIKFSRAGGSAVIDVIDGPQEITVHVRDNGIGIPPQDHERVFEKFYRTQAAQRLTGSGLGLPIAKLLVELHGGRIWVDSDGQNGTTVSFTVPAAPRV